MDSSSKQYKYKMIAECQLDIAKFLLAVSVKNISASQMSAEGASFPDMLVEFTSLMTLDEIRDCLGRIEYGGVMAQTLELENANRKK